MLSSIARRLKWFCQRLSDVDLIIKKICCLTIGLGLSPRWLTHRVISDKVHRLFVMLSYFRRNRFVQLLSLIPILILLLYIIVSIDLVYTGICELDIWNCSEGEQLSSKLYLFCSNTETKNSFSVTNNCNC